MAAIEIIDAGAIVPAPRPRPDTSPALVYLARLAKGSRPAQISALNAIAGMVTPGATLDVFPWHHLRFQHVQAIRAELQDRYSPATVNRMLSAIKGVLRDAWRLGLISAEDRERACDIANVRGKRLPKGRGLTGAELAALFATCDGSSAGMRDAALLAVLYSGGLRRSEAVALDVDDFDELRGMLRIRAGKGNKERLVPVSDRAAAYVARFVDHMRQERGFTLERGAPLFVRASKSGALLDGARLSAQAVLYILQKRCAAAGVDACTPHDLRRSCASDLLDAGVDIATVQGILGHANVQTTARYDRRGDRTRKAAAQRLTLP